jgi:arabinofuranosyltransferase
VSVRLLIKRTIPGLWVMSAVAASTVYLLAARLRGLTGFALDDAWIHQTYARNLATTRLLAFIPGQPSAGSTSGVWTALIALGYLLHADYRWWTYALGITCLAATALGVWRLSLQLFPDHPCAAVLAGTFCALEWHLVWAAVSGMETVLFTALSIWLLVTATRRQSSIQHSALVGLLCGLLVMTRPEGLLLVGLVWLALIVQNGPLRRATWTSLVGMVVVMAVLLAPWVVFNGYSNGTPFPNTFSAKQREYAALLALIPFVRRLAQVFFAPLIGAQILLVPGLIAAARSLTSRCWRGKTPWMQLVPLVWALAHLTSYALRLPVTYQHGRYEMPVIPILIVLGVGGTTALLHRTWHDVRLVPRVLTRAAVLAIAMTQLGFVAIGARAYATDVAVIEGEMVRVARWLGANTAPGDLIAAHDVGAIGYFAQRPLIDLAGLVSPEVIPFIRDEARLWELTQQRHAAYLVTFPSWYPKMIKEPGLVPIFTGNSPDSPEHLTVYRIP